MSNIYLAITVLCKSHLSSLPGAIFLTVITKNEKKSLVSHSFPNSAIPPSCKLWGIGGGQGNWFFLKSVNQPRSQMKSGTNTFITEGDKPKLSNGLAGMNWFSIDQSPVNAPISGAIRVVSDWGCLFLESPGYQQAERVLLVCAYAQSPSERQRYQHQLLADHHVTGSLQGR